MKKIANAKTRAYLDQLSGLMGQFLNKAPERKEAATWSDHPTLKYMMRNALISHFGEKQWQALSSEQRLAIYEDFADMLLAEYDTPGDTGNSYIEQKHTEAAAKEYCRRIGRANLAAYANAQL